MTTFYLTLLLISAVLIIAECFHFGGILLPLGLAILPAVGLHYFGFIASIGSVLGVWLAGSTVLIVGAQMLIHRYFPPDVANQESNEQMDAYGQVVEVLENVTPDNEQGRIRYQGTSWQATSLGRPLKAGDKARLVSRDNLVWVIEPVDKDQDGRPDRWAELEDKRPRK